MNKHLNAVKAIFDKKKQTVSAKLLQAGLTAEQKTALDATMAEITAALAEIEAAEAEVSNEQIASIFSKAIERLSTITEQSVDQVEAKVQAQLAKLQAKINSGNNGQSKKFAAKLSLSMLKKSGEKNEEGYKPFSAGVDVSAWTPESEVDVVETFRPLIGVAAGFEQSTTSNTSIKVRKFGITSGAVAVVQPHAAAPVIEMAGTQNIVNVAKYMGVVEGVASEDLEDESGLEAEIQNEALENLSTVENASAIALLTNAAQTYSNATFGTKKYADEKTAIAAIIDQVRKALGTRQSVICFAANSSQWALLNDLRNENGTPIPIDSIFGNIQKIEDNSLTADNFLCWAKKFAKIKTYKGKTADWYRGIKVVTDQGAITAVYSEWRTDEESVRVRERKAMYVSDTSVVVKGTISGVKAAVTTPPIGG